ncbi:MAG: hypothetical protein PHW82_01145 [Bacteroidales bacterium]|nr:hypothetical protein [Bacteroidales bacterium]
MESKKTLVFHETSSRYWAIKFNRFINESFFNCTAMINNLGKILSIHFIVFIKTSLVHDKNY